MPTAAAIDLVADLPAIDDIDAEWPKEVILTALDFPSSAKRSLCAYHWEGRAAVSLGEIFELLISSDVDPRPGYIISRLLDHRNVGRQSVIRIIEGVATMDFGRRCNLEWSRRYERFRDSHRMKGSSTYSWSFPITEEGKKSARYRVGGLHRP
jgi:hypothetical protein